MRDPNDPGPRLKEVDVSAKIKGEPGPPLLSCLIVPFARKLSKGSPVPTWMLSVGNAHHPRKEGILGVRQLWRLQVGVKEKGIPPHTTDHLHSCRSWTTTRIPLMLGMRLSGFVRRSSLSSPAPGGSAPLRGHRKASRVPDRGAREVVIFCPRRLSRTRLVSWLPRTTAIPTRGGLS